MKRTGFTPPAGGGRGSWSEALAGQSGAAGATAVPPGSYNGQPCPAVRAPGGGGGAGRGRGDSPSKRQPLRRLRKWQQSLSMDIFKDLKKMYNDAGVTIYAVKNQKVNGTDEDLDFQFTVAKTLGATHVTAELPPHSDTSTATLKRVGDWALKHGMYAAYHTHAQGGMDSIR